MDADSWRSSTRLPLLENSLHINNNRENADRFIPNRSAMGFGYARYMLTEGKKIKEKPTEEAISPWLEDYRKRLAEALDMNKTRILEFKNKPTKPVELIPKCILSPPPQSKSSKPMRYIPQSSEKTLYAPGIIDEFDLNLLDWGTSNVLSMALENTVHLWNADDGSTSELVTVDDEDGPITSVCWAADGRRLAIGLNNSHVQLWDSVDAKLVDKYYERNILT